MQTDLFSNYQQILIKITMEPKPFILICQMLTHRILLIAIHSK